MALILDGAVSGPTGYLNGAQVDAWLASRFTSVPAAGDYPPSGSPDAGPVLSGTNFGGPGQWQLTVPSIAAYYVRVTYPVGATNAKSYWAYDDSLVLTTGAQGAQGVQGYQGTQGYQGSQGAQGTQGSQGSTGAQGYQGNQGVQGSQGNMGLQGPQGTQGTQGYQGFQGFQGLTGPQGAPSTVQGPQGYQGFQGTQGYQGNQGTMGNTGAQGPQGYQGLTGAQGPQGYQGDLGNQGAQGPQGFQGYQGSQGYQGVQGYQGTQGTQGNQGTQGTQGVQGATGPQGPQGYQGTQGNQGTQGAIYYTGSGTSNTIGTGVKTFTVSSGLSYTNGQTVIAADAATGNNYMIGTVTLYSGTTLSINVTVTQGSGGFSAWNINLSGTQGPQGAQGALGPQGVTGAQGAQGIGIAPGGTTGQALIKNSNTNYDTGWQSQLPLSGGTMVGAITMGTNRIISLAAPGAVGDALRAGDFSNGVGPRFHVSSFAVPVLAWTVEPQNAGQATAPTSNRTYWQAIYVPYAMTVTGVMFSVSTIGTSITSSSIGLYDSSGIRLVQQSNANAGFGTALTGTVTVAFSSTYNITTPGVYWIGFHVAATTTPTLIRAQSGNAAGLNFNISATAGSLNFRSGYSGTGAIPASFPAGTPTLDVGPWLFGLY